MRAQVEWDGYNWIATPETGGVTQAKRLEQLPRRLSEVAHLMARVSVDPSEWDLDIRYDELGKQAIELRAVRARVEAEEKELAARTAETAQALRSQGMNIRDIGFLTGISFQRVQQLVARKVNPSSVRRDESHAGAAQARKPA